MEDVDDIEVRQAMKDVHGARLPWILLLVSLTLGVLGILHLRRERDAALGEISTAALRATEAQARTSVLEATKTDLEKRVGTLEAERNELLAAKQAAAAQVALIEEQTARRADIQKALEEKLKAEIDGKLVFLTPEPNALHIEVLETALFDPDGVLINKNGEKILANIAAAISLLKDHDIAVLGHSDGPKAPDKWKAQLPTAWEVTAVRAASATRFLAEKTKVNSKLLTAGGVAAVRPREPGNSAAARTRNKRLEIVLNAPRPQGLSTAK